MNKSSIIYIDNNTVTAQPERYITITVNAKKVVQSWKSSLFSFEWLTPEGDIRTPETLSESDQEKFRTVSKRYSENEEMERPILGLGLLENIEIGSRKDIFLTLTSLGESAISVHILKQDEKEFKEYMAQ